MLKRYVHTFTCLLEDVLNTIHTEENVRLEADTNQPFLETSNSDFLLPEEMYWPGMNTQPHYLFVLNALYFSR